MEIQFFRIKSQEDVFNFFLYLLRDVKINFQLEKPFHEYTDGNGSKLFTNSQIDRLNVMLYTCHQLSGDSINFLLAMAKSFINASLFLKMALMDLEEGEEIIKDTCEFLDSWTKEFPMPEPAPYVKNWSLAAAHARGELKNATQYYLRSNKLEFLTEDNQVLYGVFIYGTYDAAMSDVQELINFGLKLKAI